jgi:exodeoxyribonuclease V alpha subunit
MINQVQAEEGIEYAGLQRKAVLEAVNNGVMILTGGPGTGKTTIIRAVSRILTRLGYKVAMAAPTGRAAKRMSEATQCEAKTIHRLLEAEFSGAEGSKFARNENYLLDEEVIIVDEVSMVDTALMASLLRAVKPGAKVMLIGDSDQLPSVGAGNVLCDLIASDRFPTVRLTEIFRQARESRIVTNAHAINNGELPVLTDKKSDFFFVSRENEELIIPTIVDLCINRLPKTYGEELASNIQIITPSHKGLAGTEILNSTLQGVMNPPSKQKREKKSRDRIFREGDKVMQIKNNYELEWERKGEKGSGIFNGDIGKILRIDNMNEVILISFDERVCEYPFENLDELEHAYAITVHKSQGSEYPIVVIPAYRYSPRLLTRNLLYTAVTRAQNMVIIVGSAAVVQSMVENNRLTKRYTGLKFMLDEEE